MKKRKNNKMVEDVYKGCASAHECTGMLQKILLDPEEVATFHRMYNEINGADSTDKK